MPTSRPLGYHDTSGRPQGFFVDALNAAAERAGLDLDWQVIGSVDENDRALRNGDIDIVAGVDIPGRHREFFVTDPWWTFNLTFVFPANSPIQKESDLQGKRLAVPRGAVAAITRNYHPSQIISAGSATEAAAAACRGTADAGVFATMYVRQLLFSPSEHCRPAGLRTLDSSMSLDIVLTARQASANQARALRQALDAITMEGTLAKIASRHPPVSTPLATRMAEMLRVRYERRMWLLSFVAAVIIIILGVVTVVRAGRSRRHLRIINDQLEQDLRARELAQSALRNSEARFRALFDSVPETVVAVDRSGVIVFANAKSAAMFRRPSLVGTKFETLVPQSVRETFLNLQATSSESLQSGANPASELIGVDGDGTEFPIEVSWGTVHTDERLSLALIADISERVTLRQQLIQAQKLESLGRLAGGIAHDFNNLLTVISGYAEMVLDDPALGESASESITQISQAADRASALTRQLLAFSRRQKSNPRLISVNDLLQNLEKMLKRLIGEDLELVLQLEETGMIRADPGQIEQVVVNLAVNARDAMPNGGRLSIETADFEVDPAYGSSHYHVVPGKYLMLKVTDNGSGMTPDVMEHMFEPFFSTKEQGKGTGLGLSTVYGIIKQSNGEVLVYSSPGHGTSFKILLPIVDGPVAEEPGPSDWIEVAGHETILVAEDEPEVRRFITQVLTGHGYSVLEAANGRDALEIAKSHTGPLDLLLSDVVMPELGGLELAEAVRKLHPETRVAHMSGYSNRVLGPESDQVIEKPFTASSLVKHVRQVLNFRGRRGTYAEEER